MKKTWSIILNSILLLSLGLLIFVVFSHIRPMLAEPWDKVGRIILIAALVLAAALTRKKLGPSSYTDVFLAFGVAAIVMALDYYLPTSRILGELLQVPIDTPLGIALDKLDSSAIIVAGILVTSHLTKADLFLKGGNVKKSLTIGIVAFAVCVSGSLFVATLFGAQNVTVARVVPWIPYIALFIAGNAFNEELLFRGLFLKPIGSLTSKWLANVIIAIPFVLHHTGVTYTTDALLFLAFLLPLSLAWGFITLRTKSIWGSVLFHAGTDIPVVIAIFASLD